MASHATRDHEEIRNWAEQHGACPTVVSRTGGMLRFEFNPQDSGDTLQGINWDDFFQVFDEKGLELLYDDKPGSRFHKFVYPETIEAKAEHKPPARPARSRLRMDIPEAERSGGSKRAASGSRAKSTAGTASGRTTRAVGARAGASSKGREKQAYALPKRGAGTSARSSRSSNSQGGHSVNAVSRTRATAATGRTSAGRSTTAGANKTTARGKTNAPAKTAGKAHGVSGRASRTGSRGRKAA